MKRLFSLLNLVEFGHTLSKRSSKCLIFFTIFFLQLITFNHALAQTGWDIELGLSTTSPIENCTPIKLTFDWIQALEEYDEVPLTGAVLELYIIDNDGLSFHENPGFVKQTGVEVIGGEDYIIWRMENITIPSIENGGTTAIYATLVQIGYLETISPAEIYYRGFIPNDDTGVKFGANLIPDDTFLEIGTSSSSETDLSDEINNLLPISDVVIHGTLYANVNFDFDDNYKIYMAADALIQVEDGVELKFTDRTIVQGCADVWTGIEVLDGGKLIVDGSTDQSSDKVIIQGAENGIIAHDGSKVFVKDALLRNNGTGILVPTATSGFNYIDLSVRTSTFETDSQFPGPVMITGVQANQMFTPLQSAENTFSNLTWGIYGLRSNVVSDRDYFEYCTSAGISMSGPSTTLTQAGKGLNEANPTFSHCYTGIQVQDINIVSKNNVMHDMTQGYSLRKGIFRKANIEDNIIRASRQGIETVYLIFDEMPAGIYYLTLRTSSTSATKIFTNIK